MADPETVGGVVSGAAATITVTFKVPLLLEASVASTVMVYVPATEAVLKVTTPPAMLNNPALAPERDQVTPPSEV